MDPDYLYFDPRSQGDRQAGGQFGRYLAASCGLARDCRCETRGRRRAQTRYSGVQAGARVAPHRGPAEIPGSDSGLLLDKMRDGSRRLWNSQRTSLRHGNDDHRRRTPRAIATPFFPDQSNPTPANTQGSPAILIPPPDGVG